MPEIKSLSRRVLIELLRRLNDKELFDFADKWETLVLASNEDFDYFYDDIEKTDDRYNDEISLTHEIILGDICNQDVNGILTEQCKKTLIKYLSSNEKSSIDLIKRMNKELNKKASFKFDPIGKQQNEKAT